jgi:NAD(P)-dependent dehydrogenase (short-subunit alcohol dehydrogenase family)
MNQALRLDGMTALVSGAGGGIGRELVHRFAEAGAKVVAADRELLSTHDLPFVSQLVFDLTDGEATSRAMKAYLESSGPPDIVVANAGYTRAETLAGLEPPTWDSEVAINLNGTYAMTAMLLDRMAARGSGTCVFIASVNGLMHFGNPAYAAAKAGIIAYCKAIAVEMGGRGIRANVVCPGSVRTPAWDHRLEAQPDLLERVLAHYPLGRLVSPEEVADAALFLASPMASGITGATLTVDAGLTAGNLSFVNDVLRSG